MVSYTFLTLSVLVLAAMSLSSPIAGEDYGVPSGMVTREDAPTKSQLINDCPGGSTHNADRCTFEQIGADQIVYQYELSTGAYNCGGSTEDQTTTATISDSVTDAWTIGGGAGVSGSGGEEIPIGVSSKISVEYGRGSTQAHYLSKSVTAKPNSSQYYIQQKQLTRHNGRIRVNYPHRVSGHYIWYLNGCRNDDETGQVVNDVFTFDCSKNAQLIVDEWNAAPTTRRIK